jgi:hypothetical protein
VGLDVTMTTTIQSSPLGHGLPVTIPVRNNPPKSWKPSGTSLAQTPTSLMLERDVFRTDLTRESAAANRASSGTPGNGPGLTTCLRVSTQVVGAPDGWG